MSVEFNRFFKSKSLASTYKPTLLKCFLDLADYQVDEGGKWIKEKNDTYVIDLHFLIARFLRYYHPLRFKFNLKQQATKSTIEIYGILENYAKELGTKSTPSKKNICSDKFKKMREEAIISDAIKRQVLPKLLNDCNIYTIINNSKNVEIKKEIVDYMKDNKKLIEAGLNHMIARYLEVVNSSPNISTKLEEKIPRTTLKTKKFQEIIDMQNSCCFYCGNRGDSFAQEHFIPWNFLYQTENYNIIAACKSCNGSKNDRLTHEKYLKKIIIRNKKLDDLPMGYSEEFMRNLYENCRLDYHGKDKELWEL
jgi:hypothetical protein